MQTGSKRAVVKASVKDGMLASIGVGTDPLEFTYSYYETDKAVSLYILRRFDDTHIRIVQSYTPPEVAEKLIEAFFTSPKTDSGTEEWKHIYAIVEAVTANIVEKAVVKLGDDLVTKHGLAVAFGYWQEYDKYHVYAEAEWLQGRYSCRIYERDYVTPQEIRQSLMYFVGNVLDLVKICKT